MQVISLQSTKHVLAALRVNNEKTASRTVQDLAPDALLIPHDPELISFAITLEKLEVTNVSTNSGAFSNPLAFAVVGKDQPLDTLPELKLQAGTNPTLAGDLRGFSAILSTPPPDGTKGLCIVLRKNPDPVTGQRDDRAATLAAPSGSATFSGTLENTLPSPPVAATDEYLGVLFIQGFQPSFFKLP